MEIKVKNFGTEEVVTVNLSDLVMINDNKVRSGEPLVRSYTETRPFALGALHHIAAYPDDCISYQPVELPLEEIVKIASSKDELIEALPLLLSQSEQDLWSLRGADDLYIDMDYFMVIQGESSDADCITLDIILTLNTETLDLWYNIGYNEGEGAEHDVSPELNDNLTINFDKTTFNDVVTEELVRTHFAKHPEFYKGLDLAKGLIAAAKAK